MRTLSPLFAILAAFGLLSTVAAQTIPELARRRPANPVVRGVLRDIPASTIEELTRGATLVLEATLTKTRTYLTADEENVLTDYQVTPDRVIAGALPPPRQTPGQSTALILTVYGGEITIDGFTVEAVDYNMEAPRSGGRFLLFLKPFGSEAGRYQVYHTGAFELDQQRVKPLRKGDVRYRDLAAKRLDELILEIERAKTQK